VRHGIRLKGRVVWQRTGGESGTIELSKSNRSFLRDYSEVEIAMAKGVDAAIEIWKAGVVAVIGDRAVESNVAVEHGILVAGDCEFALDSFDRVLVVGGGKATAAMAAGLSRCLDDVVPVRGRINVPMGTAEGLELGRIQVCEARPTGVNEPTELAVTGTEAMIADLQAASHRDLCIALLSGGGSALLVAPVDGVTLADKVAVTRHLSGAGASIEQLNTVRKKLSRVKGGGLARASRAGQMLTLVLSDVLGDPLDTIASGPTVDDSTTAEDALEVLRRFDPRRELASSVYRCIESQSGRGHTTTADHPVVIIGNNAMAIDAAGVRAERLGFSHAMDASTDDEGTAEEVGGRLAAMAVAMLRGGEAEPDCLITGGEPVVRLIAPQQRGRGGRNQQLVLAALVALASDPSFQFDDRKRLVLLAGGTDGEDGPTDAAGAILSEQVWNAMDHLALNPADYLHRNDAYHFFQLTGGLFITGPTGTNVCDLRVVVIAGK